MKKLLLLFIALAPFISMAQAGLGTFESQPLPTADTYYVNYSNLGMDVGFEEAGVHYPCVYDFVFGDYYWISGFAYSNKTDSITSGFGNQYSAKPGIGNNGSSKYVVAWGEENWIKKSMPWRFRSLYVTNSTYAYNSMRDGDGFAKKFGGPSGNDSDWFKLIIRGYQNGVRNPANDSIEVYLADFRFSDNSKDYILKDWKKVSFPFSFMPSDSLSFRLSSSDTSFGYINTPTYFCLDDVELFTMGVETTPFDQFATLAPNPASNFLRLNIKDQEQRTLTLLDNAGRIISNFVVKNQQNEINISSLPAGQYLIRLEGKTGVATSKFIKL